LCCSNTCCAEHKIGSRQRVGSFFSVCESGLRMGRAIDGGEKSKFERSDTIGRRSFASTGSCCRPTDLAVVPPADGQLQGIAAEMNEIPWESKGEWRLRRVWCPICVHRLTRSTRKRACAERAAKSVERNRERNRGRKTSEASETSETSETSVLGSERHAKS
jgi:hypothetical protein